MYLEHFHFKEMPFGLTPNVALFCGLKGHEEALNVLLFSLRSGEGFVKIIGEVGSGKTLLCRKTLDLLGEDYVTAFMPNPNLNPQELRRALALELAIDLTKMPDQYELLSVIHERLLELNQAGKRVVLLIDEAQALSLESLEAVRLLTNLETEKNKLLQVVLFGQPELDERLSKHELRQLDQRITFSYYLPVMSRDELDTYLFHRLALAGNTAGALFAKKARDRLYAASGGVPRLVNILCHKALLAAYGKGASHVTPQMMVCAINDTKTALQEEKDFTKQLWALLGLLLCIGLLVYHNKGII